MKHLYHVVNTKNAISSATEVFTYGERGYAVVEITPRQNDVPTYLMEKDVEYEKFRGVDEYLYTNKEPSTGENN